jgi:hypothetical protein
VLSYSYRDPAKKKNSFSTDGSEVVHGGRAGYAQPSRCSKTEEERVPRPPRNRILESDGGRIEAFSGDGGSGVLSQDGFDREERRTSELSRAVSRWARDDYTTRLRSAISYLCWMIKTDFKSYFLICFLIYYVCLFTKKIY